MFQLYSELVFVIHESTTQSLSLRSQSLLFFFQSSDLVFRLAFDLDIFLREATVHGFLSDQLFLEFLTVDFQFLTLAFNSSVSLLNVLQLVLEVTSDLELFVVPSFLCFQLFLQSFNPFNDLVLLEDS